MTKIIDQPVPKITNEDIKRLISRDVSSDGMKQVVTLLQTYKGDTEAGRLRVWAAILKLSNGQIERIKNNLEEAISDYRDVIAYAEYPEYSEKVGFNSSQFETETLNQIIKRDWEQYNKWLKRRKEA